MSHIPKNYQFKDSKRGDTNNKVSQLIVLYAAFEFLSYNLDSRTNRYLTEHAQPKYCIIFLIYFAKPKNSKKLVENGVPQLLMLNIHKSAITWFVYQLTIKTEIG